MGWSGNVRETATALTRHEAARIGRAEATPGSS
jgi:hypothetical protein